MRLRYVLLGTEGLDKPFERDESPAQHEELIAVRDVYYWRPAIPQGGET